MAGLGPSSYLVGPDDFTNFGVPSTTTAAQVIQASTMLDVYLRRPQGLNYLANADGTPCAMSAKKPSKSFPIKSAIQAGINVPVEVRGPPISPDLLGQVIVFDTTSPDTMETAVVTSIVDPQNFVVDKLIYNHAQGAPGQFGLAIVEQRQLPKDRSVARLSQSPVISVLAASGRYGYGRRSDQISGAMPEANLLTELNIVGGIPLWITIDPNSLTTSDETGEVWIPAGLYVAYFNEVRMQYLAGWPNGEEPYPIKIAVATLINAKVATADLGGTLTTIKAGDTMIQRAAGALSLLDLDTQRMIDAFKAQPLY